jgi:hypothetical protein
MKAAELLDWLLSDGIREDLALVSRATALSELENVQPNVIYAEQIQSIE